MVTFSRDLASDNITVGENAIVSNKRVANNDLLWPILFIYSIKFKFLIRNLIFIIIKNIYQALHY